MTEAVKMMTTGNADPRREGEELGVIDEIVQGDLLKAAVSFAKKVLEEKKPLPRIRDMKDEAGGRCEGVLRPRARAGGEGVQGYPAPLEIVACAEAAATLPFDEGRKVERERFARLVGTSESKALRHMFFAERQTSKIPTCRRTPRFARSARAAVIGAGTMGGGIAMCFCQCGHSGDARRTTQEALDRGIQKIKGNYAATVSKGRLPSTRWTSARR